MKFKANLIEKPGNFQMDDCLIEKVVELTREEFGKLKITPLEDQSFIAENRHFMFSRDGVLHCLLALGPDSNDGILIEAAGYDYPRLAAYIPGMRDILNAELDRAVEYIVQRGTANTGSGNWVAGYEELKETLGLTLRPDNGLGEMLLEKMANREEVADVVLTRDGVDTVYCLAYCENLGESLPLELSTDRKASLFDCGVAALRDLCKPDELYTLLHDSFGLTFQEIRKHRYMSDEDLTDACAVPAPLLAEQPRVRDVLRMDSLSPSAFLGHRDSIFSIPLDAFRELADRTPEVYAAVLDARVADIRVDDSTPELLLDGVGRDEIDRLHDLLETQSRRIVGPVGPESREAPEGTESIPADTGPQEPVRFNEEFDALMEAGQATGPVMG